MTNTATTTWIARTGYGHNVGYVGYADRPGEFTADAAKAIRGDRAAVKRTLAARGWIVGANCHVEVAR